MRAQMSDQPDAGRQHLWFEHIGHCPIYQQVPAVTKRFEDERLHILRFRATRPRSFNGLVCVIVERSVGGYLVRLEKCHVRYGKK